MKSPCKFSTRTISIRNTIRSQTDAFLENRLLSAELKEFARSLVAGVRRNRSELDQVLAQTADHWSLGRMAATDRNVLRLGAYEILYSETPDRVAINEAVELAKRFGTKQSAQFVNGILDRLLTDHGATEGQKRGRTKEQQTCKQQRQHQSAAR